VLGAVDWRSIFVPDTPILEIVVRGTLVYLALFLILRVVLKREAGGISITDILVVVLIADAAQNAMAGDYKSLPDGVLLVGVLVFWSFALDWLAFHVPAFGRFVHPPPLPLVRDGRILRRNLRKELVSEDELMSMLREQGVSELADVAEAHLEGDGKVSVIQKDGRSSSGGGDDDRGPL
jgi:uncharacterized membrane protein YcaP (DUF421 family)